VEVLRGDEPVRPGELGEIAVTVLDNVAMPLIRYRTGDVGAMESEPCRCGMPFPVLRSIEGRSDDFLLTRNGKLVHGQALVYFLRDIPAISRFRVTQQSTNSLTIELVPASAGGDLPLEYIERMVNRVFEHPVSTEFILRDDLPPSPSGKYRTVISSIGKHYFGQVHTPQA
jgi:phenylacetate-CoA ligase